MREVEPIDPAEFARHTAGSSVPNEFRPGLWSLAVPLSAGHISFTLSYFVFDDRGGVHVIDPGASIPGNWGILLAALRSAGADIDQVASVVVTHLHHDHVGLAGKLASAAGVAVSMHASDIESMTSEQHGWRDLDARVDRWQVPADRRKELVASASAQMPVEPIATYQPIAHGETLGVQGRKLAVAHTPGHTRGSVCLVDADERVIFTGDHVLSTMFPGVGLGGDSDDNPIEQYLQSLESLAPFDDFEVAPGHGFRFDGLRDRRRDSAKHHLRRSREVAVALGRDPVASVWSVAASLSWTAGWQRLTGFYLRSALTQTEMHMDFVRSGQFARMS